MMMPSEIPKTRAFLDQEEQLRIDKVRTDITARLHTACSYLNEKDFKTLVERITKVQLYGEGGD